MHVQKKQLRARGGRGLGVADVARWQDPTGREKSRSLRKVDAERFRATLTADVLTGGDVGPRPGRITLLEYVERQWPPSQQHKPSTRALYELRLRLHVFPELGDRSMAGNLPSTARGFVAGLGRRHPPNTARGIQPLTRTTFRSAVTGRVIAESPFVGIKLPPGPGRPHPGPADARRGAHAPRRRALRPASSARRRRSDRGTARGAVRAHRRERGLPRAGAARSPAVLLCDRPGVYLDTPKTKDFSVRTFHSRGSPSKPWPSTWPRASHA